jgi:osomolarity two-component system sensor histidine kinase NIK1
MWVESEFGTGSIFYFTCRVTVANPDITAIAPNLAPYNKRPVLFIDRGRTGCGEEIIQHLETLDLVPHHIKPDEEIPIPSPDSNLTFDCIVVDCKDTAQRLRDIEKFRYIPLVMITPNIYVSFHSALEDGISSYMTTPCLAIDLGNAIIPALEGRAAPVVSDHSKSFNILLAEDNAVNQRLAVRILEKYHHQVTVANNGAEAFELIRKRRFDVILMDVQMPIMGGFEATAKIRDWEREKGLPRTPVVALTAHAMVGDREKCIQAQMDEYISKPLKPNQLIQTILKCATLGGALLEQQAHPDPKVPIIGVTTNGEDVGEKFHTPSESMTPVNGTPKRPTLDVRAFTDAGPEESAAGPSLSLLDTEKANAIDRVSDTESSNDSWETCSDGCSDYWMLTID